MGLKGFPRYLSRGCMNKGVSQVFVEGMYEYRGFPGICPGVFLIKCDFLRGGERERSVTSHQSDSSLTSPWWIGVCNAGWVLIGMTFPSFTCKNKNSRAPLFTKSKGLVCDRNTLIVVLYLLHTLYSDTTPRIMNGVGIRNLKFSKPKQQTGV